ncbi:MAG TPA: SurA N-terminal domain-containing protein [Vicinamibacterales bacterium]|jgi:parvulin-like peptidyl-prolyl isomerase
MTRFALALALAFTAAACRPSTGGATTASSKPVSADAWAVVNGTEITREDVEKAYRRAAPAGQQPADEEALTAKLNLLNELIVQDLLLAKAKELKIELPDSELDSAYLEAKKNIPDETYQQELKTRNLTPADMREDLRRSLLAQKVVDKEVGEKTTPTDADIKAFFEANRAQFNRPEDAVHIAQIVITPVREAQRTNRTGDDAGTPQEATAKAQMLMQKLKGGTAFGDLAADYSEDAESAQRGGDLGFVPMSALAQAPQQLRDAVLKSAPGTVQLVSAGGAHTIVLTVARDTKGQKDLSMPSVKELISSTLKGRKEQLLRAAYLINLRGDAQVQNILAKRVMETQGKIPSLAPKAPGAP